MKAKYFLLLILFVFNFIQAQVTVGGTLPTPAVSGNLTTLKAAFDLINNETYQGDITVIISGSTNEAAITAVLNASGPAVGEGNYTRVDIVQSGAALRTITGTANPVIRLNGADNVTIDGLNLLTIQNTATGVTNTITLLSDAQNNVINRCTVLGSSTSAGNGNIAILGGSTGNDNNTISNCNIGPAGSNLPINGIYVNGTTNVLNDNCTISNNYIYDYFNAGANSTGIFLDTDCSGWTISGNRFYQTATRTATANTSHKAISITTPNNAAGYTVNNNIIGFADAEGNGKTIYSSTFSTTFTGIELSTVSTFVNSVQGNIISGIDYRSGSTTISNPGFFNGIFITGPVNLGTITPNVIGSTSLANSITVETTTSNATAERFTGIVVTTNGTASTISQNIVSGIATVGGATYGYSFGAIVISGSGTFAVTNNVIGSSSITNSIALGDTATTTGISFFTGITSGATGAGVTINGNTIQSASIYGNSAVSALTAVFSSANAATSVVTINSNIINNLRSFSTGLVTGISATGSIAALSISSNTLTDFQLNENASPFEGIRSNVNATSAVTISNNMLGTASNNFVQTTDNYTSTVIGIITANGTTSTNLTIANNDFRRIINNILTTGTYSFISTGGIASSLVITANTFNNLSLSTTGNVNFIFDGTTVQAGGQKTVSSNSIVGTFVKNGATGNVMCVQSTVAAVLGATINQSSNNFSNITVGGTSTISGLINGDGNNNSKNINDNIFNNWSAQSGAIIGIQVTGKGTGSSVSSNTVTNFSTLGNITGISILAVGNAAALAVNNNTVTNLNSTGTGTGLFVIGLVSTNNSTVVNISNSIINNLTIAGTGNSFVSAIRCNGGTGTTNIFSNRISSLSTSSASGSFAYSVLIDGTNSTVNVYKNKVYDISSTSPTVVLYGIVSSGGTNLNVYNNLITDLRATNGSNGLTDLIRGIGIIGNTANSTIRVSYNTVLLTGSGGTNFSTSALFHQRDATATTRNLVLRNNILINRCTPSGTGVSSALRRDNASFSNFDISSNYNIYFAGTPSTSNLIYFDGTNRRQTLNAYKSNNGGRDFDSETENVNFLTDLPASINFLRPSTTADTYVESTGVNLAGITDDYIGTIRYDNGGYLGTSTTGTDVGAYEIEGIRPTGPVVVTGAIVGNGPYPTLSAAFDAINAGSQTGANIGVKINTDIDQVAIPVILNAGTWTSMTISPNGALKVFGATPVGTALITLNGADNVTINGGNSFGNSLILENTTVSSAVGTSTLKFINDASSNVITNTIIRGAGNMDLATAGGVVFFSTGTTTGNDSNTISNCSVEPSEGNLPSKLIYSGGSTASLAIANSLNTITNCNLSDNFLTTGSAAIYATTGNTNWTITSNRIFQTTPRTFTTNGILYGIYFSSPTFGVGQTISSNIIGYASSTQTGVTTLNGNTFNGNFDGIYIETASGTANTINSNIISDISLNSAAGTFNGIVTAGTSNVTNMTSNIVRNVSLLTSTGVVAGITLGGGGTKTLTTNTLENISRNTAGTLYGIFGSGTSTSTYTTNTITALSSSSASASTIYGIRGNAASGNGTFSTNNINNLSGNNGTSIYGISFETGTGVATMTANSVSNITSTGGTNPIVIGINKTNNANGILTRNIVFNLASDTSNPTVSGIVINHPSTVTITNNRIADLRAPSANAINPINGINITNATTATVVFNTVLLSATGGGTNFGSSAFNVQAATNIISTNNIFVNNSVAQGTGRSTAVRFFNTINFATNYDPRSKANNYFSNTGTIYTDGIVDDATVANFQTRVTPDDASSINSNPTFISTDGTNINFLKFDFNVVNAISNAALPDVAATVDCDNAARNASTPDMGADEFSGEAVITSFTPTNLCSTGGQTVTINGFNLNVGGAPTILFDGVAGTIVSHSPTVVVVTPPTPLTGTTFTLQTTFGPAVISAPYAVFSPPIAGTVSADQTFIPNSTAANITIISSSNFTAISWQRANNSVFTGATTIAGQTTETLSGASLGSITANTWIRAVLTNPGACLPAVTSAPIRLIIHTTWNGVTWSEGAPNAGIGAIISANLTLNSDLTAGNLTINNVTVNVSANVNVNLTNNIVVTGASGRINFLNNSSLVQTNSTPPAANSGNIYYNRQTSTLNNNYDFVYWGSPVTDQPIGRIWMNSNASDTFYDWNHISASWRGLDLFTTMTPGKGYIARAWNNTTGINRDNVLSPTFLIPGTWNANFKGTPNNGDISVAVGAADNLIANPYPSAIDLHSFALDSDNISRLTGVFQFWTHNTPINISNNSYTADDYATYIVDLNAGTGAGSAAASGGNAPDRYVDAGQGFFANSQSAGNIIFKNAHRVAGSNNAFYRTASNFNVENEPEPEPAPVLESSKFWLNLSNANGLFKQQMITYTEKATNGFDARLDAPTQSGNPNIDFYSIIPSYKFAIQSRKLPFEVVDVVNLGYKTVLAGTYKIETDHYDGLFNNQEYYLRDNLTGIVHDIRNNPYTFTTAVGTFENRFQIIYEYTCAQTTMWDGQRWSNGLPSLTKGAVIFEDFTATADLSICTLEIIGDAKVIVPAGFDFTVQHNIIVAEGAELIFENNANLIQISKAANKGDITMKRNVSLRRLEYTFWSSPVMNQNVLAFSPLTLENRFYNYNETTNNFVELNTPGAQTFEGGKGYSIRAPNNFLTTPTTFNGIFKGVPANGDIEILGTKNNLGYNLVGNPYPSVIDADLFMAQNPSVLYFWSKASLTAQSGENYATYTTLGGASAIAGGDIPNGDIQAGQGFFSRIPASNNIRFNNNMRILSNSTQFFRNSLTPNVSTENTTQSQPTTTVEKHRFWLNLNNASTAFNQIALGYMTGATNLVDSAIDGQLLSNSTTSLYSIIGNEVFSIQGRALPFANTDVIKLGFKTNLNGAFTIALQDFDGLFTGNNVSIFIKDSSTGAIHNLKLSPFTFNTIAGTFDNRFEIIFTNGVLSNNDLIATNNNVTVSNVDNVLKIKSLNQNISKVVVYDLLGRNIFKQNNVDATYFETNKIAISQQAVIVKIVLENGIVETRKLIF